MNPEIAAAIPEWLVYVSVAANVALAVTAGWALWYARRRWGTAQIQTRLTHEQTRAAEEQAKAARIQATAATDTVTQAKVRTLLDVARDFNSSELTEARAQFQELRQTVEQALLADDKYTHLPENRRLGHAQLEYSRQLYALRDNDLQRYLTILRLPGYFEMIGLLVTREYLDFEDIYELYSGAITRVDEVVGTHVQKRQEEPGMPSGYLKHFRSLVGKTRERMG